MPQLLRSLKGMMMPPPPPTPTTPHPMDVDALKTEKTPSPLPHKKEEGKGEDLVLIRVNGEIHYMCPVCEVVRGSKNGCDAHIWEKNTGKALVCAYCAFSTYNMDSLNRHAKKAHN